METQNELIEKAKKLLKKQKISNTIVIEINGNVVAVVEKDLKGNISVIHEEKNVKARNQ